MSISWLITNALASVLMPPLSLMLLAAWGWRLSRRWRKTGITMIWLAAFLLVGLSTQAGSRLLIMPLEARSLPVPDLVHSGAQAIVVLGGGKLVDAPEDAGRDQASPASLMRLRHGARLQRLTGLPVLVSGGSPEGGGDSEAQVMARSMTRDFGVDVRWVEDASDNTAQNAQLTYDKLSHEGIRRILLVTDAMHMPRAQRAFAAAGFDVVPATTYFRARRPLDVASFIPKARELENSSYAIHEWIGLLWYQLRREFA
jgi:uncharacterized SAM-binding protein YcdF (DUF218 family)